MKMHEKLKNNLTLYFIASLLLFGKCCQSENVVIPEIGTIIGREGVTEWTKQKMFEFLAIPYAKSPSKNLRFKLPVSAVNQEETTIFADQHGISCPVYDELKQLSDKELAKDLEDCLHLAIYTKNLTSKFPVMFYIHGGALHRGAARQFSGKFLLEKNVVFVVAQYRLGPLGFMTTQTDDMPGNIGIHDCIMALNWVKSYIQYFGGDPNQITIFGVSSGGLISSALLLNPAVPEDLFQRVIMQSGNVFLPGAIKTNSIELARNVSKLSNCKRKDTIPEINKCLTELPLLDLFRLYDENMKSGAHATIGIVENSNFPFSTLDLISYSGPIKNISVMVGANKHDGNLRAENLIKIINETAGLTDPEYNKYRLLDTHLQNLGIIDESGTVKNFLETILFDQQTMVNGNFAEMLPGILDITSTFFYKSPALKMAQLQAQKYPERTYLYTFDYHSNNSLFASHLHPLFANGVHHADELFYLYPINALNEKDTAMGMKIVDLWTSFAITGVPKADGFPESPSLARYSGPYLRINKVSSIGTDYRKEFTVITDEARKASEENYVNFGHQ